MLNIFLLDKNYNNFKNKVLSNRIFKYSDLLKSIEEYKNLFKIDIIGKSIEQRNIYKISWGKGNKKILIWSQMHGNESTGTLSMLDILNFFKKGGKLVNFLIEKLTFLFIPMLNPDGAEKFTRYNAIGIDLNRDALSLQSPEINILFEEVKKNQPYILFNLHDQRSIYNVSNTKNPAILSFLAPSEDKKKSITNNRKITMRIISSINKEIYKIIPGNIGRYSDTFYPTATGDCFQKNGYPCLLFEAGYSLNDFYKKESRKYNTLAILVGFYTLAIEKNLSEDYMSYFSIPKNENKLIDKIYRNVIIQKYKIKYTIDIGIMIFENYNINSKKLEFINKIIDIGDLRYFYGREEIQANGKYFFSKNGNNYPIIGDIENFKII